MAGDPHWSSVSLLLHGDGANGSTTFTDNSPTPKTPTANGNVQISTAQKKFGTGAIAFDGSGDFLEYAPNDAFGFDTGDFTLEFFVRLSAYSAAFTGAYGAAILSTYRAGTGAPMGWQVRINGTASSYTTINVYTGTTDLNFGGLNLALNTWHHVAVTRSSGSIRVFVGGVQVGGTVSNSDNFTASQTISRPLLIGQLNEAAYRFYLNGFLDGCRITKGVARYTANFTLPAEAFPDRAPQLSGSVRDDTGALCARTVRAYLRSSGALVSSTTSDATTGVFTLDTTSLAAHTVVALDDVAGTQYNALILDNLTPV